MFKALVLFGDNSIDGTGANRFAADYAGSVAGIVRQSCSEMDVAAFADDVHSLALIIAGASGGLFGIGSKISDVEREAIAELNAVFAARPASRSARINPARFAFAWAGTFERLFSDTLGIPADSLEIAAYVASILDFCLQANASPAEYKRQIESVVRALAERNRIPSDKLAQLVGERAEAYVGLTLNAIRSIHRQQHSDNTNPEIQMAWEFYSRTAHSDPRGHMIDLITTVAPMMMDFVIEAEKLALGE